MADKIDYAIKVTPVGTCEVEGRTFKAIDSDVARTLFSSNIDLDWSGTGTGWSDGVCTHKSSGGGTIVAPSSDGVWIKHSGYDYNESFPGYKSTIENTSLVTITAGVEVDHDGVWILHSSVIAKLNAGEAIFLPKANTTFTLSDDGTAAAIEYAILT